MKWVKATGGIVLFIIAIFFAYQSFESSFNPRRGHEGESGQHKITPQMQAMMQQASKKKQEDAGKKAPDASSDKKSARDAAAHKRPASEQTHKDGGD